MASLFESSTNKQIWNFSPQSIPGLTLWMDAADDSTITKSGTAISQWTDKSVNQAVFTPEYPVFPPKTSASEDGYKSVYFDMSTSNKALITSNTVPLFSSYNDSSGNPQGNLCGFIVLTPQSSPLSNLFAAYVGDTTYLSATSYNRWSVNIHNVNVVTSSGIGEFYLTSSNSRAILGFTYNSALPSGNNITTIFSGISTVYDNSNIGGDGFYKSVTANLRIFGNVNKAHYHEILMYSAALTTTQRQQIEGYLAWKWGIEGGRSNSRDLISGHPYAKAGSVNAGPYLKAFKPLDISNCCMWYDGADKSSMTISGSQITQWNDKSGNGYNLTRTSTTGPTITTSSNAVGYDIVFNGNNGLRNISMPSPGISTSQFTYFMVFVNNEPSYGRFVSGSNIDGDNSDPSGFCVTGSGGGSQANEVYFVTGNTNALLTTVVAANYHIASCVSSISSKGIVYLDGATPGWGMYTSTTTPLAFTKFGIGNIPNNGGGQLKGNSVMNEFVAFTSAFTDSQRQQMEGYLAWKWGLQRATYKIPITHPFYNFPSASVPFDLRLLGNLYMWYDGADASTITGSATMTQWNDKSGNGNNLTTSAGPTRTAVSTNPVGYDIVFNGSLNNFMSITPLAVAINTTSFSYFTVFINNDPIDGYGRVASAGMTSDIGVDTTGFFISNDGATTSAPFKLYCGKGSPAINPPLTKGSYHIVSLVFTSTPSATVFYDGAQVGTFTPAAPNFNFTNFSLGRTIGGGNPLTGVINESIAFTSAISTSQRQQVEGYLAWKWGLQASLPATHPYLKAPL